MARRANEKHYFNFEDSVGRDSTSAPIDGHGNIVSHRGEDGGGWGVRGSGGGDGSGDEESYAPRKSFVAKRGWGGTKMIEVKSNALFSSLVFFLSASVSVILFVK